ncbi:MAG: DUF2510 domain-containing protein [Marmoricola sp.]
MTCPNGHPVTEHDRACPTCGQPVNQAPRGDVTGPAPAGWYPSGPGQQRYWDGAGWTPHTAPLTAQSAYLPAQQRKPFPWGPVVAIAAVLIAVVVAAIILVAVLIYNSASDYVDRDCRHSASGTYPGGEDSGSPQHDQWQQYVDRCKDNGNIVVQGPATSRS